MRKLIHSLFAVIVILNFAGCSGGGGSSSSSTTDDDTTEVTSAFPSDLAVVSPLENSTALAKPANYKVMRETGTATTAYEWATDSIDALISGTGTVSELFDPMLFLSTDVNADCFGPRLLYEDHPGDGSLPDGELPTGDLGIWTEYNGSTTEACAAAQLNARMSGVSKRSLMGLMGFASMIGVAADNGVSLPAAGSTTDLTTEMTALGITGTTFNSATITQSTAGEWSYELDLTYDDAGVLKDIVVTMLHKPGASTYEYEGLLTYLINDRYDPPGNCPAATSSTSTNVTHNGSLHYIRNSETDLVFQNRYGMFCGTGESGLTASVPGAGVTGNVVDPAEDWANNFSIFTADFDPANIAGSYSYVWQAGKMDSDSRVFDLELNPNSPMDGEAYYGYGDNVDTTDGSITGFYCNWAGPGAHTKGAYAQRQHMTYNSTTAVFEPTNAGASDITYAPTTSCEYDGSGSFKYDRDIDADLSDETAATVNVASGETLEFDLLTPTIGTTTYSTITEAITARGYTLPVYP